MWEDGYIYIFKRNCSTYINNTIRCWIMWFYFSCEMLRLCLVFLEFLNKKMFYPFCRLVSYQSKFYLKIHMFMCIGWLLADWVYVNELFKCDCICVCLNGGFFGWREQHLWKLNTINVPMPLFIYCLYYGFMLESAQKIDRIKIRDNLNDLMR